MRAGPVALLNPSPYRLYGRARGHTLRPRQQLLLEVTLPRLVYDPAVGFGAGLTELWLEIGFGGGEHSLAQVTAHPQSALIACELFENGICSLLGKLVP